MDGSVEMLLAVDAASLSRDEVLDRLLALDELASRVSACTERALATVVTPGDAKNWDREEIGCLLRWSFPHAAARLAQATKLVTDLPATLALHEQGAISPAHTRALCDATYGLDKTVIGKVEGAVLDRAPTQTPAEFRRCITRAVHRLDPRGTEERHAEAVSKDRTVRCQPLPDGMAALSTVQSAIDAEAMWTRISALATHKRPGDLRGIDERRADILRALVLGTHYDTDDQPTAPDDDDTDDTDTGTGVAPSAAPAAGAGRANGVGPVGRGGARLVLPRQHGRHPTINIVVPLDVILGRSELPGELIGYGPIPASMCREAAADATATFRRWILSPIGELADCSTSYEPSQALTDLIIARDRTCRMPGCNRKACTCEIDHIEPFDDTNTIRANLQALCCRHHHGKHDADWHVVRRDDGVTEWTSPTGRRYDKPPDDYPISDPPDDKPSDRDPPEDDPPPF